ncbi:MAG: UDP-N-acetylglucosamine 2-epimerase (non-hydrolyzing) [Emcibacter sp.]|nr:UDP-N-acetylglucosamine 2-epimerase (non-hydrolyzing) [Emcibacter sp.]
MKILTVIGARPQFIKAATVSREIAKHNELQEIIVHTGQHYDANMSDIFFQQMQIPTPNYTLGVSGLSHGAMTGQMLEKIEDILLKEKPDWVLVYGDTNSTLSGALAASKLHIPIAHVEAGLRSFNMKMPEEQNRILTDRLSSLLLCPTSTAIDNLHKEGYENLSAKIVNVGDVMQDAAIFYEDLASIPLSIKSTDLNKPFVLATVHRAENTDDAYRLISIVNALNEINKICPVIVPLHPRTQTKIEKLDVCLEAEVIDPVGYLQIIYLLKKCQIVLTDSGGLQKEAFFFSKPCVTMREETEWVELISGGYNLLTGSDKKRILSGFSQMRNKVISDNNKLYGGGNAARYIVSELINY